MTAFVLSLAFALTAQAQTPTPTPSSVSCAAPLVIQLKVFYKRGDQPWKQDDFDSKKPENAQITLISRKRFFLSTRPFELEKKMPALGPPPSRSSYYKSVGASDNLIKWLEDNNCDTVYCRDLRLEEVTCKKGEAGCVEEFVDAYAEAKSKLNNNPKLALKWITNYAPLSTPKLKMGFFETRKAWIEKASPPKPGIIQTAMTDKNGEAYFYDLCPKIDTRYYISNIAPVQVGGENLLWETGEIIILKALKKKGKGGQPDTIELKRQEESTVISVYLTTVPAADTKLNNPDNRKSFVNKKVTVAASSEHADEGKPGGQR